jgi:4'-phosphopantetheinyl transferase
MSQRWDRAGPGDVPTPGPGQVHLWRIAVDGHDGRTVVGLAADLAPEECQRAARFRSPDDAGRWVRSRAALRSILGGYLGMAPSAVSFALGPKDKPALAGADAARLHFNLSHSGDLALVAVAPDREVGADVERIRQGLDELSLARRAFDAEMVGLLESTEPELRTSVFFRLWVRHEARVKCRGTGIGDGPEAADHQGVLVEDVAMAADYAAAFAVASGGRPGEPGLTGRWEWDRRSRC